MPNEDLCTTREAADRLGVSLKTAQLWVERGLLEAWKTPGGHRRIRVESVERLLAGRRGEPAPAAARVLLVEDDEDLRQLYAAQMQTWGLPIEIDVADNGVEGLLRIGERRPDLLITDLDMPEIDGVQMIRRLCRDRRYAAMSILVVTGLDAAAVEARGGLPPGVALLHKPLAFAELKGFVQACVMLNARRRA